MNVLEWATWYHQQGVSIVPQIPGEKRPPVRWKDYQEQQAPIEVVHSWCAQFPNAGVAAVLGPVSNLLAIDVDGPAANQALVSRLGAVPHAPKVISGSRKPYRYHLFFRHPRIATGACATPWHSQLEFRGQGGMIVLPPSLHKSGHRYVWEAGMSLADIAPPEVPSPIMEALRAEALRKRQRKSITVPAGRVKAPDITGISSNTRQFLQGVYAAGPQWNNRLFAAACDLCGNGVTLTDAMPMLLAGAKPVDFTEEDNAKRTIESAYAEDRVPGRAIMKAATPQEPTATWQTGSITINEMKHPGRRHLPQPGQITLRN